VKHQAAIDRDSVGDRPPSSASAQRRALGHLSGHEPTLGGTMADVGTRSFDNIYTFELVAPGMRGRLRLLFRGSLDRHRRRLCDLVTKGAADTA